MTKRSYSVRAIWDEEAGVYYADSDIIGLHIEATNLDEFEQVMMDVAPGLVIANHLSEEELLSTPLKDLIPAILWQRPAVAGADA